MSGAVVVNVVVKADFGCDLNLDFIKLGLGDRAEFNPEHFPAIVYRPRPKEEGKETVLIFRTGRLICTGVSSAEKGKKVIGDLVQRFTEIGVDVPSPPETEPMSASELDQRVMEAMSLGETVYTNYCLYTDNWTTPYGDAGGFVRRWIDRGPIRLELEDLTVKDVETIRGKLSILTKGDCLRVLRCISQETMTLEEIARAAGIDEGNARECLETLRKARLQWQSTEKQTVYEATGGRVLLHLLSMILKLVLEPSQWSVVGREELYK